MTIVIKVENLCKEYRLGQISGGTLREDFSRWWARRLGKPDPYLKIGEADHGNRSKAKYWGSSGGTAPGKAHC
jgi:lipopolysaccharide transport system ATP-binding protein